MDGIPTPPSRDRRTPRVGGGRGPRRRPPDGAGGAPHPARGDPAGLRVEPRTVGLAVRGRSFTVWDSDPEAALRWAGELARGLPARSRSEAARRLHEHCDESVETPRLGAGTEAPMKHRDERAARWQGRPAGHGVPHVLLAEDDEDFRSLLSQAFRSRGFAVTECRDGPGLVSELGTYVLFGPGGRFDVVVSDIRMPGASALEILEAMRECEGVPPVILITAFPSADTRTHARQLGVAAVLEKPFEIEALLARAEKLLGRSPGGGEPCP